MVKLLLSNKAKTLEELRDNIKSACVLDFIRFSVSEYSKDPEKIVEKVRTKFDRVKVIVRSSSFCEDNFQCSNAGHYVTKINIDSRNSRELKDGICAVINSYDKFIEHDEILIQPMLSNVSMSGVIFTADIDTLSPYYVINYDTSGQCDAVTSGNNKIGLNTYVHFKYASLEYSEERVKKLILAAQECETLFGTEFLDIEFAYANNKVFIFQVRPLVSSGKEDLSKVNLSILLLKVQKKIQKLSLQHCHILGRKSIFGIMPDWNPAEIIGVRPRKLALSLYKELITDSIWAHQRYNYGYRNLRSFPLLISFLGVPFVDVRASFNSFIPRSLNDHIAEKLVNYYLDKLESCPYLHDKIEFEIVYSCYYLNLPQRLLELKRHGFNKNEIKKIEFSLLGLTNNIISLPNSIYKQDLRNIEKLKARHDKVVASSLSLIEKIYWLVEDCKHYGTLVFAGVARAAFIAVQFLTSFVETGVLTMKESDFFLNSLRTVSKELSIDLFKLSNNQITKNVFLQKYGHLRPGTYDILSLRYDEDFSGYFQKPNGVPLVDDTFIWTNEQLKKIQFALNENGLNIVANNLVLFIKEAIEAREYSKLMFTRTLSEILCLVELFGEKYGFNKESMSFISIKTILEMYSSLDHQDIKEVLAHEVEKNKESYRHTKAVRFPSLIVDPQDIFGFHMLSGQPTFVTLRRVKADIVLEENIKTQEVQGKIVLLRFADPGYDFLFSKNISGLITAYGGTNSHMVIRCAELGIPAVIGIGEQEFNRLSKFRKIEIDAENKCIMS